MTMSHDDDKNSAMSTYHYSRRNIVVSHGCHFQLKIKKTQHMENSN